MNWIWFSILTALLWGIYYISIEQVIKAIDKKSIIVITCFINLLIYLIFSHQNLISDIQKVSQNQNCLKYLILAILASVLGNYMSISAIETSNASVASSLEITYPFWCILFAWLFFGSTLSYLSILGIIVVFAGTLLIIWGK